MDTENLIGSAWLATVHHIELVVPLHVRSSIGGSRSSTLIDGAEIEVFVESMRPRTNLRGHLTFHLKHEVLHLELLSRVFAKVDSSELVAWIDEEPSGQYARRADFFV